MYKFSRLFIKNTLLALMFLAAVGAIASLYLPSFFNQQAQKQVQVIKAVGHSLNTRSDDYSSVELTASYFDKLIKDIGQYSVLTIKYKNELLHSYTNNDVQQNYFFVPKPEILNVKVKDYNFYINFQIDYSEQLSLLTNFIAYILLLTVTFICLMTWRNYRSQTVLFNIISEQIKSDLAQLKSVDKVAEKVSDNQKTFKIPALQQGISDIKSLISEQLQNQSTIELEANKDGLTSLENRNRFVQFYEDQIVQDSPVNFGVLLITRCSELQTINQIQGFNAGDAYIKKVSQIMSNVIVTRPLGKLYRLNSSDFATILPNEQLKAAEEYANELTIKFNDYQQVNDLESVAYTGLVYFDKSKPLGELLALADTGVSIAQTHQKNAWFSQKDSGIFVNDNNNFGNQNWRQEIDSVIEGKRLRLLLQPIQPSGRNTKVYSEVLARFVKADDEMLPTASFIAMAEKLDKIIAVDKLIIETVIDEIISKNMFDSSFGINISSRSINDEHFMIWLERKLLREPNAAPRLVFEITEVGLQQNIKTAKRLVDMLHRVGSRVTVERFGIGMTSFKFFRDLTPDYIKMDSSYTHDIDDDKNNQYFLRLMVDLAHRLGINVLAESVESQEEKHTLEKLFIDGCQGFYVGKPTPF